LCLGPTGDRAQPVGGEHVVTAGESRCALDDRPRLRRQRDGVLATVLAALARYHPQPPLQVELAPHHAANLVSARAGQDQQAYRLTEGALTVARLPKRAQFVVVERVRSGDLAMRALDPGTKRRVDNVAREQPVGKLRQRGAGAVGEVRPIGRDVLGQCDNVAAANAVNRATPPRGQDDLIEDALGCLRSAGARLGMSVQFQELSSQRLDAVVRIRLSAHGRLVHGRVDPAFELMPSLGRSHPGGGERERAVTRFLLRGRRVAEPEVALLAAEAVAQPETLGTRRLHHKAHAVAVRKFSALDNAVAVAPGLGTFYRERGELGSHVIPPARYPSRVTRVSRRAESGLSAHVVRCRTTDVDKLTQSQWRGGFLRHARMQNCRRLSLLVNDTGVTD